MRLGKDASNYAQLLKKAAIQRLDVNQRVVRKGRLAREVALENEREDADVRPPQGGGRLRGAWRFQIAKLEGDIAGLIHESRAPPQFVRTNGRPTWCTTLRSSPNMCVRVTRSP